MKRKQGVDALNNLIAGRIQYIILRLSHSHQTSTLTKWAVSVEPAVVFSARTSDKAAAAPPAPTNIPGAPAISADTRSDIKAAQTSSKRKPKPLVALPITIETSSTRLQTYRTT